MRREHALWTLISGMVLDATIHQTLLLFFFYLGTVLIG